MSNISSRPATFIFRRPTSLKHGPQKDLEGRIERFSLRTGETLLVNGFEETERVEIEVRVGLAAGDELAASRGQLGRQGR